MSREAFRFVHATALCLDEPLVGTGPLSGEDRELAEESTLLAWEEVVNTAIGGNVDFLILSGNSCDARHDSLRARVALEAGFEKLAAHDIAVFVAPGNLDPVSYWNRKLNLPPNVTLMGDEEQEPVAILRDGRVLASIFLVADAESDEAHWSSSGPAVMRGSHGPFSIGIVPAGTPIRWRDHRPVPLQQPGVTEAALTLVQTAIEKQVSYLALGEGTPATHRYAGGLAHDPGATQGLSRRATGSRGCSVVHVDANLQVNIDPVAVAPIRWEEIPLEVDRHSNLEDVVERMALKVLDTEQDNDEQLWILTWCMSGEGKLFESLEDQTMVHQLWLRIEQELSGETSVRRLHRLDRMSKRQPDPKQPEQVTGLIHDFQAILDESGKTLVSQVKADIDRLEWLHQPQYQLVREYILHASAGRLQAQAKALAAGWLD